jgi:hypothetical protein
MNPDNNKPCEPINPRELKPGDCVQGVGVVRTVRFPGTGIAVMFENGFGWLYGFYDTVYVERKEVMPDKSPTV